MPSQVASQLPCRSPDEIINALISAKEDHFLTIYTQSGASFSGKALSSTRDSSNTYFVFQLLNPSGKTWAEELVYIDAANISHLHVHNFLRNLPILSFGSVAYDPERKAPPRIEIERQMGQIEMQMEEMLGREIVLDVIWTSLKKTASSLLNLQEILECYPAVLKNTSQDTIGKEAWAGIKSCVFVSAEDLNEPVITKQDGKIIFSTNFEKVLPGQLQQFLEQNISKVL